jgi:EAL domain-containing protein (putative c-di-GMP-specific phosphodiesterase class I)
MGMYIVGIEELSLMVVEDSVVQRMHAESLLTKLGARTVLTAENGVDALQKLEAARVTDILITDLEMPDMDGIELIRRVAEQQLIRALIVVSSRGEAILAAVEAMAQERGISVLGIAIKPLIEEDLKLLIGQFGRHEVVQHTEAAAFAFTLDDIRQALLQEQFVLHYQPKVSTHGEVLRGVESLIRWQHPVYGLVAPVHFVPLAEEGGLIGEMTTWILDAALKQLHDWHSHGLTISVAVNLSAKSLAAPDLADHIADAAARAGVNPKYLVLEITETAVMSDLALSLGTLARLRLKGFGLSIDDFGTGFSSMQQLSRIPFTELKIDRSLVNGAANNPAMHQILESIIEMSKKLHLTSLGEGPDNEADWQLLQHLGCDVAQGFYIAKPMPGEELTDWLKRRTKKQ